MHQLSYTYLGGHHVGCFCWSQYSSFPSALDAIPPDAPGFEASNYRPSSRNASWKSIFRRVWLVKTEWKSPRIFLWLIMGCFMAMTREKGVNTTIFGRSHVSKLHGLSDIHSVTFQLYWEQCIPAWQVEWQTTSKYVGVIDIYMCVCDGKVEQWGFGGMAFALWSFRMGMNKLCLFINPCQKLCQQNYTTNFKQTCVNLLFIWAL